MKVFLILDSLANAGTENSYLQLLPEFSEEIEILVVYFYPDHFLADKFNKAGIRVQFLENTNRYGFDVGVKKLLKLVKLEKPDLMVSSLMRSNLISRMVSLISGVPLIGTLVNDSYNLIRIREHKGRGYWKFKTFWLLDKWTSSIPKFWIANALCLIQSHEHTLKINVDRATAVYRGREVPSRSFDHGLLLKHFVGYGRLIKRKGWLELIQAFTMVQEEHADSTLTIFGEGPLRKSLEEKIKELGLTHKVRLPGSISQVQDKLYDYDCFVFPSWYEGFSGALVEAMMVGIPIIASDIPMNLEAVTSNSNALTFPVKDVKELANRMKYAISNVEEMAQFGINARKEAIERFDIKKIAQEYEAVLRKVLTPPNLP
ncbi:glycosyltransferase [Echinicola sediminis]